MEEKEVNYKKSLLIALLSVSFLGAITTTRVFASQNQTSVGVQGAQINGTDKIAKQIQGNDALQMHKNLATQTKRMTSQKVMITLEKYVLGRSLDITGSYNGTDAVYLRAEVNGKKDTLVPSRELASGKISYYVGNLKASDNVDMVLFNKNYQEIGRQQVTFEEPVKPVITLENYIVGRSLVISGSYHGASATYMRAEVNGRKDYLVSTESLKRGIINYYVGNLKPTDKVAIVLFDQNYQEIGRQVVTITMPPKEPITLNKYIVGKSTFITGSYAGTNAVYLRAEVNGKKERLVTSKELASGKINYYVGKLKQNDQAEIVLFDKNYQEISRQMVPMSVEQVFDIKGQSVDGNPNKLLIKFKDQQLTISENYLPGRSVMMNDQFKNKLYFSISVMGPQGENLFSMSWNGNSRVSNRQMGTFEIPNGSTISMYHAQGNTLFDTNDNVALRNKTGTNYIYKVENDRLVLINVS